MALIDWFTGLPDWIIIHPGVSVAAYVTGLACMVTGTVRLHLHRRGRG